MDYTEQFLFNNLELKPNSYFEYPHYFYFLKRVKTPLLNTKILRKYLYESKDKISLKQFLIYIWLFKNYDFNLKKKTYHHIPNRTKIFQLLIVELFKMNDIRSIIELLEMIYTSIQNFEYVRKLYDPESTLRIIIEYVVHGNFDYQNLSDERKIIPYKFYQKTDTCDIIEFKDRKRSSSIVTWAWGKRDCIFNYHDMNFVNNMVYVIISLQNKLKNYLNVLIENNLLCRLNCYISIPDGVSIKSLYSLIYTHSDTKSVCSSSYSNFFSKRNERNRKNTYDIIYDITKYIPQFGDCLIDIIINYI